MSIDSNKSWDWLYDRVYEPGIHAEIKERRRKGEQIMK